MAFKNQTEKELFSRGLSKSLSSFISTGLGNSIDSPSGLSFIVLDGVNAIIQMNGDGVTDVSTELQWAVNYAKTNNIPLLIPTPSVSYKVNSPIYITGNSSGYESITIIGEGKSYASNSPTLVYTLIDHSSILDKPCFVIDKARCSKIIGLAFKGPNVAPNSISQYPVETGWVTAGVRDTRYSPQCAIAVDSRIGTTPADGGYTGFTYFGNANGGSHDIEFKDLRIENSNVGILNGPHASSTNGDCFQFNNLSIVGCQYGLSFGQAQNRACVVNSGNYSNCRVAFTGLIHGAQQGSAPTFEIPQIGFVNRIFEFNQSVGTCSANFYAESISSIGTWGSANASSKASINLTGNFKFQSTGSFLSRPPILAAFGPVKFDSTRITDNDSPSYVYNIIGTELVTFENSVFDMADDARIQLFQAALGSRPKIKYINCHVLRGSSTYYLDDNGVNYDVIPDRLELRSGTPSVVKDMRNVYSVKPRVSNTTTSIGTITSVTFGATTVTINLSSLQTYVIVGDIIGAMLKPLSSGGTGVSAPAMRVTAVNVNQLVCSYLVDPSLIDQTTTNSALSTHVRLYYSFWACSKSFTGDVTLNSDQITNLSRSNVLKVGDWVVGSGIPANARIIEVTATTARMHVVGTSTNLTTTISDCIVTPISVSDDTIDVKAFGALGDNSTDDGPAIRAALTFARSISSATKRITVVVPPGTYLFSGQLKISRYVDFDMTGAFLKSTSQINEPKVIFGELGVYTDYATYKGLNLENSWSFGGSTGHKFNDVNLIGFQFLNVSHSNIDIRANKGPFTVGVQIAADLYSAYNIFNINSIVSCRYGVNIHSYGASSGNGWVNENKFFGMNIQSTSNFAKFGSTAGIWFSSNGTGYSSHNNNVFTTPCFQLTAPSAFPASGTTVGYLERYYNSSTFNEYKLILPVSESNLMGTTPPSHTTGTATDSNGNTWEYIGPCRATPMFYDNAGSTNRVSGARWEGGLGPFMIGKGIPATFQVGSKSNFNVFEVFLRTGVTSTGQGDIDETTWSNNVNASASNEIISYERKNTQSITFNDLHRKAITSSVGTTVPGFEHSDKDDTIQSKYSTGLTILHDGLKISGTSSVLALYLNTNTTKRFAVSYSLPRSNVNNGRIRLKCANDSKVYFNDLNSGTIARAWVNGASANVSEISLPGPATDNRYVGIHKDTKYLRVLFQGETTTKSIISSISLRPLINNLKSVDEVIELSNRINLDKDTRYSFGTPLVGFFTVVGEVIQNLDTSDGQPVNWVVKTAGMLANDWVASTVYEIGSLVAYSGNVYKSLTDHTSGTYFVNDTANWELVSTIAVLKASPQVYPFLHQPVTFSPSIYSGQKLATTTVTGQSEARATGTRSLRINVEDGVNYVYIGLGNTAAEAETNCTTGIAGDNRFIIMPATMADISMESYKYYAWVGVGGSVYIRITQGV
jgi:hypothetical protein